MSDSTLTPLKKLRTALGLRAIDVAAACELEQSTFSKIETAANGYRASSEAAAKIVNYFGGALNLDHVLFPEKHPEYLRPLGVK
jgi:transcriptional regulator with XRE-family HTH domain